MKLLLLKILLQRRARDEGFTLPMVIALGLVMILLGTTNIVKSSEENLNAISQNSASDALAIAEVGITKYRELLDRNRILTVQNDNRWATVAGIANQTCDVITTTPIAWEDGGTAAAPSDRTKWWEIKENIDGNPGDETIGEYQLVSYIYDRDNNPNDPGENNQFAQNDDEVNTTDQYTYNDNNYNPRGLLTVKGRSPDGSEAQIEVEIPLRINQQDMNNIAPALWINNRSTGYLNNLDTNLGNLNIAAGNNIVLSTPASSSGCTDPADDPAPSGGTNIVIGDPRRVPSINYIPNTLITNAEGASQIQTSLSDVSGDYIVGRKIEKPYRELKKQEIDDGETFSQSIHCKDISDCRYYYNLGNSPFTIDQKTYTDGIAKATLYINSDLTIDNKDVGSGISSSYFEIYVNGARDITITTTAGDPVEIDAFIHAPSSVLKITGDGDVIFRGSVWVNRVINSTTGNVTIEPDNTDTSSIASEKSYEHYTTTVRRTPRPLLGSPTNWVKEEVE